MNKEPGPDKRDQMTEGPQTILNDSNAPVLSGDFHGPVIIQSSFAQPPIPHEIPLPPLDFTGRDKVLEELQGIFEHDTAIISLRGMGGVGKSALAFALAERLKDRFPDGQLFVSMLGTSPKPLTSQEAMAQVIRSYQPTLRLPESKAELANLYRSVLDGKHALLLLDNALDEGQVRPLLPTAKGLLIVTTRRKFKLPGMFIRDLEVLKLDKAVDLLQSTAGSNLSGGQTQEKGTWEDLAQLCGYLPVALRAAGSFLANTPDSSPKQYIKELQDERRRLGIIGNEGVEEDVVTKFSLSYGRLAPKIAQVFRLLSIFPGDFDAQAEEAICQDEGHLHLSELVRWCLVDYQRPSREGEGRYHLHDLVRLFAAEKLEEEEGEVPRNDGLKPNDAVRISAEMRHAKHYMNVLSEANRLFENGGESAIAGLKLFDRDWKNIQSGQRWAEERSRGAYESTDLALNLSNRYPNAGFLMLDLRQHCDERIRWLETALKAARQLKNRTMEEAHLCNLGLAYNDRGEVRTAIDYYKQALEVDREIDNKDGNGCVLSNLGLAHYYLGNARKAIKYFKKAIRKSCKIGDKRNKGRQLGNLGLAYRDLGDIKRAVRFHNLTLSISRDLSDLDLESEALYNLGENYTDLGKIEEANEYFEQSLKIVKITGNRSIEVGILLGLGKIYIGSLSIGMAIDYLQRSLILSHEIGDRRSEGDSLNNLGIAYAARRDSRKATEYYKQALAIDRRISYRKGEGTVLWNMSLALNALDKRSEAIKKAERALKIFDQIESPMAATVGQQLADWRK